VAKVKVQQAGGEIRIARGDAPKVYPVSDHIVAVPDNELADFLRRVDGAEVVTAESDPRVEPKKT
jgi:hypothetical protein